jgi:mitochondrial fission protein ELM1
MSASPDTQSLPAGLVVWRLLDGRPGHENQTAGLLAALAERRPLSAFDLRAPPRWRGWLDLVRGQCSVADGLPSPDLLLGAGRAAQAPLLACRRARGGRAVVLMNPGLPLGWFDLCVVPEHDGVSAGPGVFVSRGALNAARPAPQKRGDLGLILVGGPSRQFDWDADGLVVQLGQIVQRDPRAWVIATSRRTPAATVDVLRQQFSAAAGIVTPDQAAPGWLLGQLALAPVAWVSEDSVSMLYEALTAGAACGLLEVPARRRGRVRAGLDRLLAEGRVTAYADWAQGRPLTTAGEPLDEAGRCADWILDRWFAA